jgi:hypothetical protein
VLTWNEGCWLLNHPNCYCVNQRTKTSTIHCQIWREGNMEREVKKRTEKLNHWVETMGRWLERMIVSIVWRLDDVRVRRHFKRVEQQLRAREVQTWPNPLRLARHRNLDRLRRYWQQSRFPRNDGRPRPPAWRAPCFIDQNKRVCAVAYLVIESGHAETAARIAQDANYAYVDEMESAELAAWARTSGFSRAELALIQPAYTCPEQCLEILRTMVASEVAANIVRIWVWGLMAISTAGLNMISIAGRRWGFLLGGSIMGLGLGAGFVCLTVFLVNLWTQSLFSGLPCAQAPFGSCSMMMSTNLNLDDLMLPLATQTRISAALGVMFSLSSLSCLLVSLRHIGEGSIVRALMYFWSSVRQAIHTIKNVIHSKLQTQR